MIPHRKQAKLFELFCKNIDIYVIDAFPPPPPILVIRYVNPVDVYSKCYVL